MDFRRNIAVLTTFVGMFAAICAGQTGQSAPNAAKSAAATPATTQSDGKTTTLSVTANLVNLPVIVRDKKGAPVTTLTKADFALTVDGHPEVIRYFDRDQNLPLTLGLLVDTSQSQRGVLDEERDASWEFLDKMLTTPTGAPASAPAATAVSTATSKVEPRVADRAFIVQFAREVELLQDLTSSRPKLQAAIKELGTPNPKATNTDDDDRDNTGRPQHGGTALYDAVFLSADELMKKQQGRKALIVLSDGVDRNSKVSLDRAIEGAQRTDTIIYAIYFKGEEHRDQDNRNGGYPGGGRGGGYPGGGYPGGGYPGGGYPGGGRRGGGGQQPQQERGIDGKRVLQQMADETGGRLFEVKGKQRIAEIYDQIIEELRSQYRLAYTPDAEIAGDGYHKIDLRIPAQKALKVQTRDGYYTGK